MLGVSSELPVLWAAAQAGSNMGQAVLCWGGGAVGDVC